MVHHRFFPVFIGCRLLDCNDLAGNPCKFFRVLELLPVFLHQVRGKVCKIFLAKTNDQKIPGHNIIDVAVIVKVNCSPSSRQLKKYKFFLPAEIYLLAVFMQLASKFHVFPLVLKFQDSFANVCCCSNLYNLRSFLREYFYQ